MSVSLLERAAATAVQPPKRTIAELEIEIDSIRAAQESLFGVERLSKVRLEATAFRLAQDKKFHDTGYKRLSLEPLSWVRHSLTFQRPIFALYRIDDPVMEISNQGRVTRPAGLPSALQGQYLEVIKSLGPPSRKVVTLTSRFQGVIPQSVRPAIKQAMELFVEQTNHGEVRQQVYLMAEVKDWEVSTQDVPRPPRFVLDPLIVGWDSHDLWLAGSFDMTNVEAYVAREFPGITVPQHLALPAPK